MFLDRIVATKRTEVEALGASFSIQQYERIIAELPPCRGFRRALSAAGRKRQMGLIAEVKKASPSKGLIRQDFHPVQLATAYEAAGADCVSVLTDECYFQGSSAYLQQVRSSVGLPLLRKDFTIDYRQIYEARTIGADAVLLIAAILTDAQLSEYYDLAQALGMDALVEVHDDEELHRVLALDKVKLIGINNRDLRTFATDLQTTEKLMAAIPGSVTVISESGIAGKHDMAYLQGVGADGVLIGEHFMRQPDVGDAVEALMGPVRA